MCLNAFAAGAPPQIQLGTIAYSSTRPREGRRKEREGERMVMSGNGMGGVEEERCKKGGEEIREEFLRG